MIPPGIKTELSRAWRIDEAELPDDESAVRSMYLIHLKLSDLFVVASDEARWLRDPLPALDNKKPLNCLLSGLSGIRGVEGIVTRMTNWN